MLIITATYEKPGSPPWTYKIRIRPREYHINRVLDALRISRNEIEGVHMIDCASIFFGPTPCWPSWDEKKLTRRKLRTRFLCVLAASVNP